MIQECIKRENKMELLPDSAEQIAESLDVDGVKANIDQGFQAAMLELENTKKGNLN